MRRLALIATMFLAGCATRPQQAARPDVPAPVARSSDEVRLLGASAGELIGLFGRPALQVPEGNSLKLQFRGRGCVLDTYLYPSAGGVMRVTHVDARTSGGAKTDPTNCGNALAVAS